MPGPLDKAGYPNIDLADIGRRPNLGYGTVEGVRAACIAGGATALLEEDLTASAISFDVDDASRFPTGPFTVQIAYERMRVTDVTGDTLTVTRGYDNTQARVHKKNLTVYEVLTEYVYLVSVEPVKSIDRIFVDGFRQIEGFSAYTGQSADEHPDWPGKAVITFSADGYIGRQRNLETKNARDVEAGETVTAEGKGFQAGPISPTGRPQATVIFGSSQGKVKKQTYAAELENEGVSEKAVRAVVGDNATGSVIINRIVHIPASSKVRVTLEQKGGEWETFFRLLPLNAEIIVHLMGKEVVREKLPGWMDSLVTYGPPPGPVSDDRVHENGSSYIKLNPTGRLSTWVAYDSTSIGDIYDQTHYAEVENAGGSAATVKLVSADPGITTRKTSRHTVAAGASATISHGHDGGGWDTMTRLVIETGELRVKRLRKEVRYSTAEMLQERALAHTASARAVIGDDITVDADWTVDQTGDYGGAGNLIERPDIVMKHFIVERMGFSPEDIDASSFAAAGASFAAAISGGYKFGFIIDGQIMPSEFLRNLAFECRSTVRYRKGKWYLDFLPDDAPAAVKAISRSDLAGEYAKFIFHSTPIVDLANDLTAKYRRVYGETENFNGVATASDETSNTKYGTYPLCLEFNAVRSEAMARDVLEHILLQRKTPLLTVEFPVFYEHFDLAAGDTIEIDNPLFNGTKFYIEEIVRQDKFRATVKAVEWWG